MRKLFTVFSLTLAFAGVAGAWENHAFLTKRTLQYLPTNFEPGDLTYKPLEEVLEQTPQVLAAELNIRGEKVKWDWQPNPRLSAREQFIEILSYSSEEPDYGMDQELDLGPDQMYMGGKTGMSSQGLRHMYYGAWDWTMPVVTFHYPLHEMGLAPERAQIYFELARKCWGKGSPFWAYRFLGWGLHYLEDLSQPFHTTQFAIASLLAWGSATDGWQKFIEESTRRVGNFHVGYEDFVDRSIQDSAQVIRWNAVFAAPKPLPDLYTELQTQTYLPIDAAAKILARASSRLVNPLVRAQHGFLKEALLQPGLKLLDGLTDESGRRKIDWKPIVEKAEREQNQDYKIWIATTDTALSNEAVVAKWYIERFRDSVGQK